MRKVRTNYKQDTLKIMKILRTASLGSSFTGSFVTFRKHNLTTQEDWTFSLTQ